MSETAIPPVDPEVGDIGDRLEEIVARVMENLGAEGQDDTWYLSAVNAALLYVIEHENRYTVGLPDDEITVNGLVGFATRIYLDAFSPGGAQVAIGDPSFTPIFQPEHLYKHWRHYFARLRGAWGIA